MSANRQSTPLRQTFGRDCLYQVLVNLLVNAIKFTPTHGKISLRMRVEHDHPVISVKDTGIGIAPELLSKIFDRFWQADSSYHQGKGLGLGLAIARHIVEAQDGTLHASSEGMDKGTTFIVRLPSAGAQREQEE